jgi:hypothetical protein
METIDKKEAIIFSILDAYNKIDHLVKKLYLCTEKEEIDTLFEENKIADYKERSILLSKCMGVIKSFGISEETTDEEDYEFDCAVFVEGTWRLLD